MSLLTYISVTVSLALALVWGGLKIIKIFKKPKKIFTQEEYEALKKRIRIVWIEDSIKMLPFKELEKELFFIKHIKRVTQSDLNALESNSYDIVILDIRNVVSPRLIKKDGLGLLERIKQKSPQTYVLVCSGESFDVDESKILNQADDLLKKTASYAEIRDKLERIIKINFFYKDELNKIINRIRHEIPIEKQKRVIDLIETTCSSEISKDELKANLDSLRIAAGCIRDILQAVTAIIQ